MKLKPTELLWDHKNFDYDTTQYHFREWALSIVQEIEPSISELETLHVNVEPEKLEKIKTHFHGASLRREFMEMVDSFMERYIPERITNKRYMVQRYPTLRIVEPNQAKRSRRLVFHQGIWVGNGKGVRTVWMPLTRCYESNSIQFLSLEKSRELTKKNIDECWTLEQFESECFKNCFPVSLNYGQCHLFLQEHMHGNVNNDTDITRVSMDMRILVEGEPYHRRLPGGFFRFPGDYQSDIEQDNSNRKFITYDGWSSSFSQNIPLPLQRHQMDSYCNKNKIYPLDCRLESEYNDWCPSLQHYIREKPDGIVMLSMFSLPDNVEWRNNILNLALEHGVELHFANEYIVLKDKNDLELIQKYLEFSPK